MNDEQKSLLIKLWVKKADSALGDAVLLPTRENQR
jgi:hypothetical protein